MKLINCDCFHLFWLTIERLFTVQYAVRMGATEYEVIRRQRLGLCWIGVYMSEGPAVQH
jgi:hypothetical protein